MRTTESVSGRETPQHRHDKLSILIVDDNSDDLTLMAQILRSSGYEIRLAKDSTQALRTATSYPPDLIILDIMMPGMNGLDACSVLKSRRDLRRIPIVFVTALNEKLDKVKAFEMGGVDYIAKPFDPDEVLLRIDLHIATSVHLNRLELSLKQLELEKDIRSHPTKSEMQNSVHLTDREIDCLVWLARGLRNDMISARLGIRPATVEMHLSNARRKLAAATREQALVIAIQLGLVVP